VDWIVFLKVYFKVLFVFVTIVSVLYIFYIIEIMEKITKMKGEKSIYPNTVYRISTKAFIVDEQKRILLVKEWDLWWELPWWWLDFNEDPISWLKREIHEELWVDARIVDNKPIYVWTQRRSVKKMYFMFLWYKVVVDTTKIRLEWDGLEKEEFDEWRFFSRKEILDIELHENIKKLLKFYDPNDFL